MMKAAGGEAFLSNPKALSVVGQDSEGSPAEAAEDKECTIEGLCVATHSPFYVTHHDMCRWPRARGQAFDPMDFVPVAGDT